MRILILRGGALGDFIVTLPAIAALRSKWPNARIELVGNATAAQLAFGRGLLDAVHSQHDARWSALYGSAPMPDDLARWIAAFDLVVNYWPDPEQELARRFPARAEQIFVTAGAHPATNPAALHFLAALRGRGVTPGPLVYSLRTPHPDRRSLALHPGSGSPRKNWPIDRWKTLSEWLERELGLDVVVISGEAESPRTLEGIGERFHSRSINDVADRLSQCRLFIGHDSGISHLAASAGVPCVLLFGPTDPAIWAPPSPTVRVIQRGADLSRISLEHVQSAVTAALRDQS